MFYVALVIGFERPSYTFLETDNDRLITDVYLVKENNCKTERTFIVTITVDDPISCFINPATVQNDYAISADSQSVHVEFQSTAQRATYAFFLFSDSLSEGFEGFRSIALPSRLNEIPALYDIPNGLSSVYLDTTIIIEDENGKHCCVVDAF